MDLGKIMGMFGFDADAAKELTENPQIQNMMQNPEIQAFMQNPDLSDIMTQASQIAAQGGIMPDDVERMTENLGGMDGLMSQVNDLLGGLGFDEIDLDEEAAEYQPEAVDAGDRAFVIELKAWLKDTLADLPAEDVCMLEIGYHLVFPGEDAEQVTGDLWLGYNTAQTDAENQANGRERWNIAHWTDNHFRQMDEEPLNDWYESQGYDLSEDDENEIKQHIYDLAAVAVMELHKERFTEQHFGRKIPFIIEDYEYNQQTAIRAVKANGGKELFDGGFFADCGFEASEE